jgi:hypothetical protein
MTEPSPGTPDPALERRWETIHAKLRAHYDRLAERGSLVASTSASGRRVWAVRFADARGGRFVHRNIYICGDDQAELLRRTRAWLVGCRRVSAEVERLARLGGAIGMIARRLHPRLTPPMRRPQIGITVMPDGAGGHDDRTEGPIG